MSFLFLFPQHHQVRPQPQRLIMLVGMLSPFHGRDQYKMGEVTLGDTVLRGKREKD